MGPYLQHQKASITSQSGQSNKWAAKCCNKKNWNDSFRIWSQKILNFIVGYICGIETKWKRTNEAKDWPQLQLFLVHQMPKGASITAGAVCYNTGLSLILKSSYTSNKFITRRITASRLTTDFVLNARFNSVVYPIFLFYC